MLLSPKSYPRPLGCLLALIVGCFPSMLAAGILVQEPFNYPNGPLVSVSAGVWATHSGTTGQVEVLSGRAYLTGSESEDVNTTLAGAPYPATTNTVLYASVTVNFSSLPSASGEYFLHFKDTTTSNFRAKLFALTSGTGAGQFRLGVANGTNAVASVTNTTSLSLSNDYRVYL